VLVSVCYYIINMQTRDRLSRMRQSLHELAQEIERLVLVFAEREVLVKGTVYEQRRKCGKPTCRCATGEPHSSIILSRSEEGRTRLIAIPSGHLKDLQVLTERYQRFRRARARLGQIYKKMISLIDQLEESRLREP
jgi:DNA repair exonuclease SbcCD ATPase subunit